MKWKQFAVAAAVLVVLGGGTWYGVEHRKTDTAVSTPAPSVVASPVQTQALSYQGEDGKTAMELLKAKYTVETKHYSFGDSVQSINGLSADEKHYWAFYVNGAYASVGADAYQSKAADTLEWKYEEIK